MELKQDGRTQQNYRPTVWMATALLVLLALIGAGCASQPGLAPGQPPEVVTDDMVNNLAQEMYCPICENIPLDVCPTQACAQWRDLIREKLEQGWSEEQVKEYFVAQYGDRVLSEPPRRGLNWLVYILPPIGFLIGVVVVVGVLRGMRAKNEPAVGTQPESKAETKAEDPYLRKLEEELRKRD